jgi:hypothetical protein
MVGSQMGSHPIAEAFDLSQWANWFNSLEPSFVFLLCLPFAVAAAGVLADLVRKRASLTSETAPHSIDQSPKD